MQNSLTNNLVWQKLEIKKSQFFSVAISVSSVQDFEDILTQVKIDNKKASHFCTAVICNGQEKCTDDGEPSGTAGKPILGVMKKNGLQNAGVIVVRYFGGIKLGAGGLLRAYVKSSALAVSNFKSE